MKRHAVMFTGERQVNWIEEALPDPLGAKLLIQSSLSAISGGTELLLYRNQIPSELPLDATISGLDSKPGYPTKYGYAVVGQVIDASSNDLKSFIGQTIFAFHPHESHFWLSADQIIPIPQDLPEENAVFLPNMETAINLVQDGRPLVGELAAIYGQGIVGLLTTAVMARFPLEALVAFEPLGFRRDLAAQFGADLCLDPSTSDPSGKVHARFHTTDDSIFDLSFELAGVPESLDLAIRQARFHGRIVVGSWYGTKRANLDLGGEFHRNRIQILSSQVSSIDPSLRGRWSKNRRLQWAWKMIEIINPQILITHRMPASQADEAYKLLDTQPESTLQVVLEYR